MRKIGWIETYTGKKIYPLNMCQSNQTSICIDDIAHALSQTCRFGGHTREFYSVAQHACLVAMMVPNEFKLAALHHDDAEAYLGDVVSPVKGDVYLDQPDIDPGVDNDFSGLLPYSEYEKHFTSLIFKTLELGDSSIAGSPPVKLADKAALYFEQSVLMTGEVKYENKPTHEMIKLLADHNIRLGSSFKCWSPKEAKIRFMMTHYNLYKRGYPPSAYGDRKR